MSQPGASNPAGEALARLMELVRRLRAPDGCPWDRKQTPASAAKYLVEEACEAAEAVEHLGPAEARGELGDLLFQVVFQAELYAEQGQFDLAQVIEEIRAKMIRRHPHVFGEEQARTVDQVLGLWQDIKKAERGPGPGSLLDGIPGGMPGLAKAHKLGQRAAKAGFDWTSADQVREKIFEEQDELARETTPERAQEELGDLLFSWAQWGRHRGLDPEVGLRGANQRFQARFQLMERLAREQGRELAELDPAAQDRLWRQAKAALAEPGD